DASIGHCSLGATLDSLLSARKIRVGFWRAGWGAMGAALLLTPPAAAAAEGPPVVLALVIDTSGSLGRQDLDEARELTVGVPAAPPPPGRQAAVSPSDDESPLALERPSDAAAVRAAVAALPKGGSSPALNDALYDASRYLRDAPGRRRAILLVTDGRDERSAV